jgi:hypothetical protein
MAINLHKTQSDVYKDMFVYNNTRFGVIVCSRGWGKSFEVAAGAVTALFELFELAPNVQNKNVAIIAPTFDQVTDIYYPVLANLFQLPKFALRESKNLGRFVFPNNVELHLLSYEAVERMRGKGYYFVGVDEPSSMTKGQPLKEAWENIIYPTISTRWSPMHADMYGARNAGRAMFAGTPKGYNFLYDLYNFQELDTDWKGYNFDYTDSPLLDPKEVLKAKDKMDPIRFASEYLAQFKESGNNVFYCMDRKVHVKPCDPFGLDETVHVCIDFNVGVMAASAFAVRGGQMQFLKEFRGSPDTEQLAIRLRGTFGERPIHSYPDPTGGARKTSSTVGTTDFSILRANKIKVFTKGQGNVPIVDSVNAVNKMLMTASGITSMYFDPIGCPETIISMERTKWVDKNPDLAAIDKSEGVEHFSDGVRYATDYLFPIKAAGIASVAKGFAF